MTDVMPRETEYDLLGRDEQPLKIFGSLLGFATSRSEIHSHDIVFPNDETIEREIRIHEERLAALPKRFTGTTLKLAHDELDAYITLLADDESPRKYADQGDRCSACRWFEVRIFTVTREHTGDEMKGGWVEPCAKYLVLTYGLSDVPGEVAKRRAQWTNSPYTVIETLTQRRGNSAFLPATSARVLSEAAAFDEQIARAYVNRAVA